MLKYISIFFILFFIGCTTREYYEPTKNISNSDFDVINLEYKLNKIINGVYQTSNLHVIDTKNNYTYDDIKFSLINADEQYILLSDNINKIKIIDRKKHTFKIYNVKKAVLSATFKDNLIAILYFDNSMSIFDVTKQRIVFNSYQASAYTVDDSVANPYFLDDIIIFPTVNGNIVIVSKETKKLIKTITIDTKERFANIKFLNVLNDNLIIASSHTIMVLSSTTLKKKDYDIRQILIKNNYIYISTLDGQILQLDNNLMVIKKSKLKFGRINAIGFGDKYFYAYESQGYLIQFDNNFDIRHIFEYSKSDDDKVFIFNKTLYIANQAIKLK